LKPSRRVVSISTPSSPLAAAGNLESIFSSLSPTRIATLRWPRATVVSN
jgi:hypothetical protein